MHPLEYTRVISDGSAYEMNIKTPTDLRSLLEKLFPAFNAEWEEGEVCESLHQVMFAFTPFFGSHAQEFGASQVRQLAEFINRSVEKDDDLENAVSTCFLEHLHQINSERLMKPYLTNTARRKLRA